ncbi:MAG: methyltransferase domain-containing protein [Synechococcaceae bacterium WB9_2_112]|nr:methyltransferase domain-containing protein [Synechococcaceae bacterium WB9_2_112]
MNQPRPASCSRFDRQASHYDSHAGLQRAIAWRLAHYAARLPLVPGPRADLGAGSGLVGLALRQQAPRLELLQLDGSAGLLRRNPLASKSRALLWDLDQELPPELNRCSLITSSFALQWLQDPATRLRHWAAALAPGGWLALAVPVAGSFSQWHQAAERAQVPCTARRLPDADTLVSAAASVLALGCLRRLVFSVRYGPGGHAFLRHLRRLGAGHSDQGSLSATQWRRLLAHWPPGDVVSWQVLLLVGQRPERLAP